VCGSFPDYDKSDFGTCASSALLVLSGSIGPRQRSQRRRSPGFGVPMKPGLGTNVLNTTFLGVQTPSRVPLT